MLARSTSISALLTLLWSYGVCEALLLAMPHVAVAQRALLSHRVILELSTHCTLGIVLLVRLEWFPAGGSVVPITLVC